MCGHCARIDEFRGCRSGSQHMREVMHNTEREEIGEFGRILWEPIGRQVPTKNDYLANAFAAYQ